MAGTGPDTYVPANVGVKGMAEAGEQAQIGLKLFAAAHHEKTYDVAGAIAYKEDIEKQIEALASLIKGLPGKDNKKTRVEKEKDKKKLTDDVKYIDACKVIKGLDSQNGNFMKVEAAVVERKEEARVEDEEEKKEDPPVEDEKEEREEKEKEQLEHALRTAGFSKAERDELEKLNADIMARKKDLKEQGLSGGQCNKDRGVIELAKRISDLTEKEEAAAAECLKSNTQQPDEKKPGSKKNLSTEAQMEIESIEEELKELMEKLRTEGKSKKEIAANPDCKALVLAKKIAVDLTKKLNLDAAVNPDHKDSTAKSKLGKGTKPKK